MELRRYLFENRVTIRTFAKDINYAIQTISMIVNGRQKAGKKLAKIIEKHTNGAVTADEVIYESQARIREKKATEQLLLFK